MNKDQKKIVFLDRDGVINKEIGFLHKIDDFKFIDGAIESFKYFQSAGFNLIVVTNQSGIYRGYFSEESFHILNDWMINQFKNKGVKLLDVYYCPHGPNSNCKCRKPQPGMFLKASKEHNIDLKNSWMIGDKETDIQAANRAGINNTILVKSGHKSIDKTDAKFVLESIKNCVELIK